MMSTQTVPYSHKRGSISDNVEYLTDATDRGVTWLEGFGEGQRLITLRQAQDSWYFTEVRKHVRCSIRRNHYDHQSSISYEVWNGTKWELKHLMGIEGTPAEDIYGSAPLYKLDTELFRSTADIVWRIAESFGDL